jgi:membrane-associated protein
LTLLIVIVVLAAIAGDTVGYEVGRRYGQRLLGLPILARRSQAIDTARERLRAKGGGVVFLSRFTAFLRAVTPGLAGASHMPYRRFLPWNAAGGILWGSGFTLLGYFAGASYKKVENYAGKFSYLILALVAIGVLTWAIKRYRSERNPASAEAEAASQPALSRR